MNEIHVAARSKGGENTDVLRLSSIQEPVSIQIAGFATQRNGKVTMKADNGVGGRVTFHKPIDGGDVWLQGEVKWGRHDDLRLQKGNYLVHIWVNGFQQLPVRLDPPKNKSRSRGFQTRVILSQPQDNVIQVVLRSLATAQSHDTEFAVDCDKPVTKRRVHLLAVSVDQGQDHSEELVESGIRALNGQRIKSPSKSQPIDFVSSAFGSGIVYGPLMAGQITPPRFYHQIQEIGTAIRSWNRSQPATDVVVVYYQGAELIDNKDGFHLTTVPREGARSDLSARLCCQQQDVGRSG